MQFNIFCNVISFLQQEDDDAVSKNDMGSQVFTDTGTYQVSIFLSPGWVILQVERCIFDYVTFEQDRNPRMERISPKKKVHSPCSLSISICFYGNLIITIKAINVSEVVV